MLKDLFKWSFDVLLLMRLKYLTLKNVVKVKLHKNCLLNTFCIYHM